MIIKMAMTTIDVNYKKQLIGKNEFLASEFF